MAYIDPITVISPRNRLKSVHVLYNSGPGQDSWSVALLNFNGNACLGIRWNGNDDEPGVGNPQSRARPVWFVVPGELEAVVRDRTEQLADLQEGGLLAGYREMANDQEHEAEALEWSEGLIGDANSQER
jgi:hypothetical protein